MHNALFHLNLTITNKVTYFANSLKWKYYDWKAITNYPIEFQQQVIFLMASLTSLGSAGLLNGGSDH